MLKIGFIENSFSNVPFLLLPKVLFASKREPMGETSISADQKQEPERHPFGAPK
jgi:hypothetical protein